MLLAPARDFASDKLSRDDQVAAEYSTAETSCPRMTMHVITQTQDHHVSSIHSPRPPRGIAVRIAKTCSNDAIKLREQTRVVHSGVDQSVSTLKACAMATKKSAQRGGSSEYKKRPPRKIPAGENPAAEVRAYQSQIMSVSSRSRARAIVPGKPSGNQPKESHETILAIFEPDSNRPLCNHLSASIRPPSRTRIVYEFACQPAKECWKESVFRKNLAAAGS